MLDRYKVFNNDIKEEMVGTQGNIAVWGDGTVNTLPCNITNSGIIATVSYDCREEESVDDLSVDYIDSLFDTLLEQTQN